MLLDVAPPRCDAAEREIQSVVGEVNEERAAFPFGFERERGRKNSGVTLALQQMGDAFAVFPLLRRQRDVLDSRALQLFDDELHQEIVDPAVACLRDFAACELFSIPNAGPAHQKLLVDSAGQVNDVRSFGQSGAKKGGSGEVAELKLAGHQCFDDRYGAS